MCMFATIIYNTVFPTKIKVGGEGGGGMNQIKSLKKYGG